jgi:anti-anti-sigma factor
LSSRWDPRRPVIDHLQPEQFAIRVLPQGGIVRVRVIGEVDRQTAPMLEEALLREVDAGSEVLLDLSEVSFIDSSGLHAIIAAAERAKFNGGALAMGSPLPPQARRMIEIAASRNCCTSVKPHCSG